MKLDYSYFKITAKKNIYDPENIQRNTGKKQEGKKLFKIHENSTFSHVNC